MKPLLLLLPLLLLGACASTSGGGGTTARGPGGEELPEPTGKPMRITLRSYSQGAVFELVGESHTDIQEQYSTLESNASRKVTYDVVMEETIKHLMDLGLDDHARPGTAPSTGRGIYTWSVEVEGPGGVVNLVVGHGSPSEHLLTMNKVQRDFVELYNQTQAMQVVYNPSGGALFDDPIRYGGKN